MNIPSVFACQLTAALLTLTVYPLGAQNIGSLAAERVRLAEITGDTGRTRSDSAARLPWLGLSNRLVKPEIRLTWNSAIPYSLNDGAMWAGRGLSASIAGGLSLVVPSRLGPIRVRLAPSLTWSQNSPFQIFAGTDPARSQYANPFYQRAASADYPMRFGDRALVALDPGSSRAELSLRGVTIGAASDDEWWGPAIRNTLILGNNAQGVPRMFARNATPIVTRAGALDVQLIAGTLTESRFFDADDENNYRALSGLRVQLRPAFDSTLVLGFARVAYATVESAFLGTLAHGADAIWRWEYIDSADAGTQEVDQIMSLFARWVFPRAGFEVYGEWARMDNPKRVAELLAAPHHTGGYTLGLQWAQPRRRRDYLRLQTELTYLEQSTVFPDRPPPDFYTGRATAHGYTQRGQPLGAAIGPGGSSQFLALDWIAPDWQGGWFVGRVRWNNDALYRNPGANFFQHDVTMLTGLRAARRSRFTDLSAELTFGYRYNYLFQWGDHNPGGFRTVDVRNLTLALMVSPR